MKTAAIVISLIISLTFLAVLIRISWNGTSFLAITPWHLMFDGYCRSTSVYKNYDAMCEKGGVYGNYTWTPDYEWKKKVEYCKEKLKNVAGCYVGVSVDTFACGCLG